MINPCDHPYEIAFGLATGQNEGDFDLRARFPHANPQKALFVCGHTGQPVEGYMMHSTRDYV